MDEKIFTELLFTDVLRGKHATGVAAVKGQCRDVQIHKRAVPAPLYLELGSAIAHLNRFTQNTVVLGHNRHATKGNSNDPEGAHPFQHGHITLVHNGSLTSHHNLTEEHFTVDSEAICRAIEVDGIEVVAPKLRGAFALVWINSEDNTLNFLRNGEREFAMAWNETANRMWWASEKGMLEWQLNRDTFTRTPVTYNECFELPVGQWISIPITHVGVNIAGRTVTELDVSDSVYVAPAYNNYNRHKSTGTTGTVGSTLLESQATSKPLANETVTEYEFGATREAALKKITAALVSEKGRDNFMVRSFVSSLDMNADAAVLDLRIGVFLTHWEPYVGTISTLGTLTGQMMEFPYTEVKIHGMAEEEYDTIYNQCDGMATAYLSGFSTPTAASVTVKMGSLMEQDDLMKFCLLLRKDSIRKAKLDDFYWDIDLIPAEDSEVKQKMKDIDAGTLKEDQAQLALVVDNVDHEPESPLRVISLADGTMVSPGGTAIFRAHDMSLTVNLRYKVIRIDYQKETGKMLLTAKVGDDQYVFHAEHWEGGTLSKEAEANDGPERILGPEGEYISVGKWQAAVSSGCCQCREVPTDPEVAETLVWMGAIFTCEVCHFTIANAGYN